MKGIVAANLAKEKELRRISGPHLSHLLLDFRVSPLGVAPKKASGEFRITALSYPQGDSVNDAIDSSICLVKYESFNLAVDMIQM